MWPHKQPNPESDLFCDTGKEFLTRRYLNEAYIVPPFIDQAMKTASSDLIQAIPGFIGIVNVGGTANGSYELRRQKNPKAATDLDFYFIGHDSVLPHLNAASEHVANLLRTFKLLPDGVLNGRNPQNFLNLDKIPEIIASGDTNLLALPFQSAYGKIDEAKRAVLSTLLKQDSKQAIWDEVASYHIQSLSIHHGTFSEAMSKDILNTYYPRKVEKFELPITVEEALAQLEAST